MSMIKWLTSHLLQHSNEPAAITQQVYVKFVLFVVYPRLMKIERILTRLLVAPLQLDCPTTHVMERQDHTKPYCMFGWSLLPMTLGNAGLLLSMKRTSW